MKNQGLLLLLARLKSAANSRVAALREVEHIVCHHAGTSRDARLLPMHGHDG